MKESACDIAPPVHPAPQSIGQPPFLLLYLVRIGGTVAAVIGCIALAGWMLDFPRLASLGQGHIPMAPSTAILFVAYGIAALLARRARCNRRARLLWLAIFALGSVIAGFLFLLSFPGIFLEIEYLGMRVKGTVDGSPIGHMSPITAFTFLLLGLSFPTVLPHPPYSAWRGKAAWWVGIVLIAGYLMLILAYLLGTPMFYGGKFIPPASTTSLAFLALGMALAALSQPLAWPETSGSDQGARFSSHVLVIVFLFLVAGIILAGYFYHTDYKKHNLAAAERQLSAIADLKKGELMLWREERLGNAAVFHNNPPFASLVRTWFLHPEADQARRDIESWFSHLRENRNYNRIFLLDAEGKSRLSFPAATYEPLSRSVRRRAIETFRTGRISFVDFYHHETSGKIFLSMLIPIFDPAHLGDPLGVIVMRIDPRAYLYPLIQRWPNPSTTAEALLVRREGQSVLFLNELRTRKNSAMNASVALERTDVPAVMAVMGREGVVRGVDYLDRPQLAALRSIPDSPWHLVARIDAEEVYGPVMERLWIMVLLLSGMLVSAGAGVGFIWRRQGARFCRDRYKARLERIELEQRLIKIAANLPGVIFQFQLSPDGSYSIPYASRGIEGIYGIWHEDAALDAAPVLEAIHPGDLADVTKSIMRSADTLSTWHNEHRVIHPHKGEIWVEGNATAESRADGSVLLYGFISDITERKRSEEEIRGNKARLRCLLNVFQHESIDNKDLLDFALSEALRMTESRFGYIYYYDEEQNQFTLNSWSDDVMQACSVQNPQTLYQLEKTGIWGETVRQRKPIMVNDFAASNPLKKGYPEGHVRLHRFLSIPLFDRGRIVAVVGVANRKAEYGDADVVQLTLLMDAVWKVTERRKAEDALLESKIRLGRAEEIRRLYDELEQRVKERTAELEASNQELEAFCYAVAHDLSTPLRGMNGFCRILLEEHADQLDDSGKEYLARIGSAAGRMGQLINDLLNLSRVTRCKLSRERLDLSAMARDIVQGLSEQEPERRVEVILPEGAEAVGDPVLVRLVLENLIGNAWKYTGKEPCPRIELGSGRIKGEYVHFVRDNGIGFDMAHASRIFVPFERLHGFSEFKGTGIGLATVQRIIARHGGRVWAESEVENGSTFCFTLEPVGQTDGLHLGM